MRSEAALASMTKLFLSPEAISDLSSILAYSVEQWGRDQAQRYVDEILDGLEKLIVFPQLGTPHDGIRPGYRAILVQHHKAYYQVHTDTVTIIRILHERMDPAANL